MMRSTDFGMPTLIELKTPEACAALCRESGLAFIELNMNLPQYQTEMLDVGQLLYIAEKYGIYYTIHLDENLNPCDFNQLVATAYTETVLQTIEVAKQISSPVLNMHLAEGVYFTLPDRRAFLFGEYEREYLQKLTVFRDRCEAAIGDAGIRICVENCNGYNRASFLLNGLDLLLKKPAFALTFDVGHNATGGLTDESVIMERADRLYHMHIHDAIPDEKRDHMTLGEGKLDLMKYLALAEEHKCRAVLEVKTVEGLGRSIEWLHDRERQGGTTE